MVKAMRRIVLWLASTVTIVVLLFGYHTSTNKTSSAGASSSASSPSTSSAGTGSNTSSSGGSTSTSSGSSSKSSSSTGSSSSSSTSSSSGSTTKAYTGSVADTRWGPVQVQLTVSGGKITKVDLLQYPNGNGRDAEINAQALPILVRETLNAQSANIDMVSGATVTSDGYLQSLQSALDKAGI
jgi:uncharacterized protein with FMN-binding domain